MIKNILIFSGWLLGCFTTLIICVAVVNMFRVPKLSPFLGAAATDSPQTRMLAFIKTPSVKGVSTSIGSADARPVLIAEFLETNQSPLKPYDYWGQFLTNLADQYQLDYRLLPSIAMQESNLCKKIPSGTYNCLGLGIHSKGTWGFPSFESNFTKAAEVLRKNYVDKGLVTPDDIQNKYTPNSNGSWEFAVNQFMKELETADF